jgi:hypothetical protein
MGDRCAVHVKEDDKDTGVYLYTHWRGGDLPEIVRKALGRRLRWDDAAYLARIIFDEMTKGQQGEETGFGISSYIPDNNYPTTIVVNCEKKTVSIDGLNWSFQEYTEFVKVSWSVIFGLKNKKESC